MSNRKKKRTLHGTVQKTIKPIAEDDPEKVQIAIEEADDLYKEIRVENVSPTKAAIGQS